jgi:DNA topoisomerase-1
MEDFLDAISRHEAEHVRYLHDFYYGNGMPGLKTKVESSLKDIDPREISRIPIGQPTEGEHREPIFVRVGRFGPFLEQGSRTASLSEDLAPDEVTVEVALEMLERGKPEAEPLGVCPETQRPVFLKQGRFGPYVQLGDGEGSEKPKNASLLKGMEPSQVDLETALKLLSLPRDVGPHPESAEPVLACNGKFGPYVKCGAESRSLPAGVSPLEVTLKEALDLLAQPKTHGRRAAAPREPLKVFEASPLTGEPVKLLDGRYGPYVTDGQTNASLPRGSNPGELTFPQALSLLAERAANAPAGKKKPARRSTGRAKATTGASAKRSGRTPRRATGT